jgi:hypothetical protein
LEPRVCRGRWREIAPWWTRRLCQLPDAEEALRRPSLTSSISRTHLKIGARLPSYCRHAARVKLLKQKHEVVSVSRSAGQFEVQREAAW